MHTKFVMNIKQTDNTDTIQAATIQLRLWPSVVQRDNEHFISVASLPTFRINLHPQYFCLVGGGNTSLLYAKNYLRTRLCSNSADHNYPRKKKITYNIVRINAQMTNQINNFKLGLVSAFLHHVVRALHSTFQILELQRVIPPPLTQNKRRLLKPVGCARFQGVT